MTELLHRELTGAIIGAYYEVYNHTSRNLPEALYERAFMLELQQRGFAVSQQDEYCIIYKDRLIGKQRLDLFVVQEIVVENKATPRLTPLNKAQTQSYLKTVGKKVGLLCNFGSEQPQFERVFFDRELNPVTVRADEQPPADWLYPDLTHQVIGGLYEVHTVLGPGFIHRMYPNACFHELRVRGLEIAPLKRMQVKYKDHILGDIPFNHLIVEGKVMVFPVAMGDTRALHLAALKDWLRSNDLQIGIIANFNAVRLQPVVVRA